MKIGERGQVTIPKDIRDRVGLTPHSEVDFYVEDGSIVLRKAPRRLDLENWRGHCNASFHDLGYSSVDAFIEDIRSQ